MHQLKSFSALHVARNRNVPATDIRKWNIMATQGTGEAWKSITCTVTWNSFSKFNCGTAYDVVTEDDDQITVMEGESAQSCRFPQQLWWVFKRGLVDPGHWKPYSNKYGCHWQWACGILAGRGGGGRGDAATSSTPKMERCFNGTAGAGHSNYCKWCWHKNCEGDEWHSRLCVLRFFSYLWSKDSNKCSYYTITLTFQLNITGKFIVKDG